MDSSEHHSTPIAGRRFLTHNSAITPGFCSLAFELCPEISQYRAAAVEDMAHKAVMLTAQEFLDNFLKGPAQSSNKPPTWKSGFNPFKNLKNAAKMKESKISELFVKAVNDHSLAPNLMMALSENRPDKGDPQQLKIDSSFYRHGLVPTDKRPHWEDQIVCAEFKAHGTANDPYDDRKPQSGKIDALAETRKEVRGQLIHYAEQAFEYRHRTSLIMLIVIGRRFRFSRWDRSGTIVTPAIDYVKQPLVLCEMLWYMGNLSDEALGLDPSATRIPRGSPEHRMMVMASLPLPTDADHSAGPLKTPIPEGAVFRYVRDKFRQSLDPHFPYYRLEVPYGGRMRCFLVGKPAFHAAGMAGRGTTGYVALDVETGKFVWLKDAWRTHYDFVDQEGSVLQQLNTAGVANIPTVVCHGDILNQETVTPTWWERKNRRSTPKNPTQFLIHRNQSSASSSRTLVNPQPVATKGTKRSASTMKEEGNSREDCPLRRHKHYRLVVEEVGLKLVDFQNGRQLLRIIFDCVTAHQDAVIKASIMHRDVSGGNILILPKVIFHQDSGNHSIKWSGLLVDWELSKPLTGRAALPRPRQPERTGTWQFMSVAVLNDHGKEIEISDELESFFYVTIYYAVRYLESNCSNVGAFIEDFFDTYSVEDDGYKCGTAKASAMQNGILQAGSHMLPLKFPKARRLDKFFDKGLQWFKAQHTVRRYELNLRLFSAQQSPVVEAEGVTDRMTADEYKEYEGFGDEEDDEEEDQPTAFQSALSDCLVQAPSESVRQDAGKLATHDAFLNALATALKAKEWPADRVPGDNVPATFIPRVKVAPHPSAGPAFKKPKIAAQTWAPGAGPDLRGNSPQTPPYSMR